LGQDGQGEAYVLASSALGPYGTTGVGGLTHLAMEQIRMLTKTDMVHVPYKGGSPLTVNLLSGQLQLGVVPLAPLMQQARSGKVKVLAVLVPKRFRLMPDVPSIRETLRAFWPNSVDSRLKRSISSMTSMGGRTQLSSKLSTELGSWSRTLVSRM
jgi:hypothetical protein